VSCYVDDLRVEEVVKMIVDTCRTGRMGDGKILIVDVPTMLSIPESGE
jgi:nitrogen regulatory protein PII